MYYHATDMKNLDSIMEKGILPSRFESVVYLAESYEDAIKFVMLRGYKEILVLPCDVGPVEETYDHSEQFFKCKAYGYEGSISPKFIDWGSARRYSNPFAFDISKLEDIGK